jgi:DNA-binding CsgD family transcriptional regulator
MLTNLEKSSASCAVFTIMFHARNGMANDEARRRFSLVAPHVRRALLIGKVIDLHKIEAAALADTLDALSSGMFIVDAAGRIIHANARGHAMLEEANVVRAPRGHLTACDLAAEQALREIFKSAEGGDTVIGRKGISVPLSARDGGHYVGHVLPLTSGARRKAGVSYSATAAIFIRKAAVDTVSPFEAIAQRFNLTAAEVRVLFATVEVGGVPEIAPILGIAEPTVKTHLHHIFEKTGTRRQADLVKVVAAYSNPLAG